MLFELIKKNNSAAFKGTLHRDFYPPFFFFQTVTYGTLLHMAKLYNYRFQIPRDILFQCKKKRLRAVGYSAESKIFVKFNKIFFGHIILCCCSFESILLFLKIGRAHV